MQNNIPTLYILELELTVLKLFYALLSKKTKK